MSKHKWRGVIKSHLSRLKVRRVVLLPPVFFSPWPQTHFLEIWTEIILSLSFFSTFIRALQHVTGEWRKGQEQSEFDLPTRPRSRETKIDSPVHDHKTPPPKIQIHQHQKDFWCSKDSIYRIRRVKNWDYEENGPLMMPFLGFWHENGPGIMQTRLLNIKWLKIFEIFAFWIFWIISSSGNNVITWMLQLRGIRIRGVTRFVTICYHIWFFKKILNRKKNKRG